MRTCTAACRTQGHTAGVLCDESWDAPETPGSHQEKGLPGNGGLGLSGRGHRHPERQQPAEQRVTARSLWRAAAWRQVAAFPAPRGPPAGTRFPNNPLLFCVAGEEETDPTNAQGSVRQSRHARGFEGEVTFGREPRCGAQGALPQREVDLLSSRIGLCSVPSLQLPSDDFGGGREHLGHFQMPGGPGRGGGRLTNA